MPYPTFALALSLLADPSWDALAPRGALRFWRLLEITQPPGQPLTSSALRVDERIVSYLKGLNYLDDRLEPLLSVVAAPGPGDLSPSQLDLVDAISTRCERAQVGAGPPVVQLCGPDATTKEAVAAGAAARLGRTLYTLPAETLAGQGGELEDVARLWHRESLLGAVALYLDAQDAELSSPGAGRARGCPLPGPQRRRDVSRHSRDVGRRAARAHGLPRRASERAAEQRTAWRRALGGSAGDRVESELAGQFRLNLPAIRRVAAEALAASPARGRELERRLWDECLLATRPRMDALAQRIEPKATWDDIVLPAAELELLREIAEPGRATAARSTSGGASPSA